MQSSTVMKSAWKTALPKLCAAAILLSLRTAPVHAQSLQLIGCTDIPELTAVSVDNAGYLYLADRAGRVIRYDRDGREQLVYSPYRPAQISGLDAWHGLRIFCFFRDLQEYTFLNRFLVSPGNYNFGGHFTFVEAAALSFDNLIWAFDQGDFSLKKYDVQLQQAQTQTPLNLLLDPGNYEISLIREYQNRVYLADKRSGILVFDNIGNFLRTLPLPEIDYFNFIDDQLYFIQGDRLIVIALYGPERQEIELPAGTEWRFALIANGHYYLFSARQLCLYK
jgi:hypothetical protein